MSRQVSELKVLVVDDQPVIVEQLCEFLETKGYVCVPAHSADEAIERYMADPAIGLLICDLHMPGRDGVELMRTLKEVDGSQRMFEAIMLTGRAEKQDAITTRSRWSSMNCLKAYVGRKRHCWNASATSTTSAD